MEGKMENKRFTQKSKICTADWLWCHQSARCNPSLSASQHPPSSLEYQSRPTGTKRIMRLSLSLLLPRFLCPHTFIPPSSSFLHAFVSLPLLAFNSWGHPGPPGSRPRMMSRLTSRGAAFWTERAAEPGLDRCMDWTEDLTTTTTWKKITCSRGLRSRRGCRPPLHLHLETSRNSQSQQALLCFCCVVNTSQVKPGKERQRGRHQEAAKGKKVTKYICSNTLSKLPSVYSSISVTDSRTCGQCVHMNVRRLSHFPPLLSETLQMSFKRKTWE